MWLKVTEGIANPFIGTALGSACVFFMKKQLSRSLQRALTGFAGGVLSADGEGKARQERVHRKRDRSTHTAVAVVERSYQGIPDELVLLL